MSDHLRSAGIDAARLDFVGRQLRPLYLATYHRIDISLDTLPYNAHTTANAALRNVYGEDMRALGVRALEETTKVLTDFHASSTVGFRKTTT